MTTGRRRTLGAAFALLLALVLGACGSGSEDGADTTSTDGAATESAQFPVTLTHALGTVTIESAPERVVALGAGDAQIAQALGANIVASVRNSSSEDGN